MQKSALDIYNAALSACHAKGRLTSLTDNKRERVECDTWYDIVVRVVQEASFWPSSRQSETLQDQEERVSTTLNNPLPDFQYTYQLPYDYLRPRYLASYMPFQLAFDVSKGCVRLHTSDPTPVLIFSALQEDVETWTSTQTMATIYGLAAHISGPITGRGELMQKNYNLANELLVQAQASAINSEDFRVEWVPEVIKARGYSGPEQTSKYYYPFGGLFGSANA